MNPETASIDQLRAHVALHEPYLRTHPNTEQVRQRAANVAAAVAGEQSPLAQKARHLPPVQSLVPPLGVSSPTARDDRFDTAVEDLIAEVYVTIDQIEAFQRRLKANEAMDDDAVVNAVLAEAVKSEDAQWSTSLSQVLAIPDIRTRDALEELESQGAVKINDRSRATIGVFLFTVTAYGRRLARGSATRNKIEPVIHLTQHISDSTIASAGVAFAPVEQNITVNPAVREVVDALMHFQAAFGDDPSAAAATTLAQGAAHELRINGWGERTATLLRAIPAALGGGAALAANVKPAYELIRALATAHNIQLPPLP
jgi:hypothetical protein